MTEQKEAKPKNSFQGRFGRSSLPFILAILSLFAFWEMWALVLNKRFLLPDVWTVLARVGHELIDPAFLQALQSSLLRLALGYPIACLLGAGLGLLAGISRSFAVYLRSLITILQAIPPITWVPFLLILFGFGNAPIIIVITIASFFPMALSVMNATEGVNRTHLELARVLGASKRQLLWKVFAPESLPAFITGAQVSFGNAWRSLISSEMVGAASVGLGFSISYSGEIADMEGVLSGIIVIGAIALLLDTFLLERIKRRLLKYRYVSGGGQN